MSRLVTPELYAEMAGPALSGQADPGALALRSLKEIRSGGLRDTPMKSLLKLDLQTALPDLMFLYFDKMSMAASLEVRVPFADHNLVSFCLALDDSRRMRRFTGKEILRRVSRGLVDDAIIDRPKRFFFRTGSSAWLVHNRERVRDALLDERARNRGIVRFSEPPVVG